jgi:hypothetical protein
MTNDQKTSFLTYYVRSLAERTRVEKSGTKLGFDWVIYNLALAADWTPHRLPFLRGGSDEFSTTKTEPEYGIDLAFLSSDRRQLFVFVLKDEVLNNQNWGKHSFDVDLRKAAAPDLSAQGAEDVREVHVILAYNKDEDQAGVELFNRLAAGLGTKVGDLATLSFERWNLTTITERVRDGLLTPSLLPQGFFSQFGYLCSQFGDLRHGSEEWTRQLMPNWRRFLSELLKDDADVRCVRLLPVALIVLREHGGTNPTAETGWIELIEWSMLAAWRVHQTTTKASVRGAIEQMWIQLYLTELNRYYQAQAANLSVEAGLDQHAGGGYVDAAASAMVALWHLARLGILALALFEIPPKDADEEPVRLRALHTVANWLVGLMNANTAAMRPLLDIHHIELFLVWRALWQIGRVRDISLWLMELQNRLFARRSGKANLPFLDGRNSLDSVFEFVAMRECPPEFCDSSSVFLMCMLELCFSLPSGERDPLLELIHRRLVLGKDDSGENMADCEPIDVLLWVPADNWDEHVLSKSLADEGESIMVGLGDITIGAANPENLAARIGRFVEISRRERPFHIPEGLPVSVVVLACLKHGSPLMPEFWRLSIFGPVESANRDTSLSLP